MCHTHVLYIFNCIRTRSRYISLITHHILYMFCIKKIASDFFKAWRFFSFQELTPHIIICRVFEVSKVYQFYSTKKRAVPRSIETPALDDRLDRSSSSTSGIGRSASKSTNSARSSTNSFSDTDLEYGATLTERSLAKTNQEMDMTHTYDSYTWLNCLFMHLCLLIFLHDFESLNHFGIFIRFEG